MKDATVAAKKNETPEQRDTRLAQQRDRYRRWFACETPERREERLAKGRAYAARNREGAQARQRRYLAKPSTRRRVRGTQLRYKYGIDITAYEDMLRSQGFECAICGSADPGRNIDLFSVDHDHTAGHVRGLLCNGCNTGLGLLRDDPALLLKAADYLLKDNLKHHG